MDNHPLTEMIKLYCHQYSDLREENLDLEPVTFHRRFGLAVQTPHNWDVLGSIKSVVDNIPGSQKVVIIFGSTDSYRTMNEALQSDTVPKKIQYFSWHEIFTGIHTASTDHRYIQKAKQLLAEADFTFFIDPPSMPEVMDQVYGQTVNCLVVLSGVGV